LSKSNIANYILTGVMAIKTNLSHILTQMMHLMLLNNQLAGLKEKGEAGVKPTSGG
jgi:hypothetical protein